MIIRIAINGLEFVSASEHVVGDFSPSYVHVHAYMRA
jgi:hypothetical protein